MDLKARKYIYHYGFLLRQYGLNPTAKGVHSIIYSMLYQKNVVSLKRDSPAGFNSVECGETS